MKIGIVTEGEAEVGALPTLFPAIESATGHSILRPVRAQVDPKAALPQIVHGASARLREQEARRAGLVILLLDREDRAECPGELAIQLEAALRRQGEWNCEVRVVIKDRMFENWLIADVGALRAQPARFNCDGAAMRAIAKSGADAVPAHAFLKQWTRNDAYRKTKDSVRILEHADPLRMAATSRSFRRFLHLLGHPAYADQSRLPAS
jgi:hypothetical protein